MTYSQGGTGSLWFAAQAAASPEEAPLLEAVRDMLAAIHTGDRDAYARMCDPELSCYETDVAPYRIDGVEFHLDLIETHRGAGAYSALVRFDMLTPRVQLLGDTAVVTYTRLMTYTGPRWAAFNESRVFARRSAAWRMVHFHRSECPWPPR